MDKPRVFILIGPQAFEKLEAELREQEVIKGNWPNGPWGTKITLNGIRAICTDAVDFDEAVLVIGHSQELWPSAEQLIKQLSFLQIGLRFSYGSSSA